MRRAMVLLAGACVIASAGCGRITEELTEEAVERGIEAETGGNVELDVDAEDGRVSFESDGESLSFESGGDIPDELTLPLRDGYSVLGSSVIGSDGESIVTVTLEYPGSDADALVDLYDDHFDGLDGVNRIENTNGGAATWFWQLPESGTSVSVSAEDAGTVTVNIQEINAS
ncbi:MAG: hypothetical protein S0880_23295 [Actinomycetota bacterium]|nr:hypothetical protein [Actinomycetota bacterium]